MSAVDSELAHHEYVFNITLWVKEKAVTIFYGNLRINW